MYTALKKKKSKSKCKEEEYFFFLISNERLLVNKENTHVHWRCNWVAVHQTLKLQCSNISNKLEQRRDLKAILHPERSEEEEI